jgi:hypothetical protein
MLRITRSVLLVLCATALLCAQDEPPAQPPAVGGGGRGGFGGAVAVPDPQPYDRVINKDAKTSKGLFAVHQIKDPQERTGERPAVELADRQDDCGRGLRRRTTRLQGDPVGTQGQSGAAARGQL